MSRPAEDGGRRPELLRSATSLRRTGGRRATPIGGVSSRGAAAALATSGAAP